jgi:hypothetical protein
VTPAAQHELLFYRQAFSETFYEGDIQIFFLLSFNLLRLLVNLSPMHIITEFQKAGKKNFWIIFLLLIKPFWDLVFKAEIFSIFQNILRYFNIFVAFTLGVLAKNDKNYWLFYALFCSLFYPEVEYICALSCRVETFTNIFLLCCCRRYYQAEWLSHHSQRWDNPSFMAQGESLRSVSWCRNFV